MSPTVIYVSDSDENRIAQLGMNATVQVAGPVELRVGGNFKDLKQRTQRAKQMSETVILGGATGHPGPPSRRCAAPAAPCAPPWREGCPRPRSRGRPGSPRQCPISPG